MGIANRIINILVLVAAIGAIVLGIMLFNKREDVADSHRKMATAIAENTAKLLEKEGVHVEKAPYVENALEISGYDSDR